MTNQDDNPMDTANLRQKAEALAKERAARTSEDSADLSPEEIRKTLHELRVHQIELEMQNEELRTAQTQIEAGRARCYDLYDLCPVAYCTLSEQGLILEANLAAATLLGTTRSTLVKQPISRFILKDDQNIYYLHRKKLFEVSEPQECELRLVKPDGEHLWAHLTGTAAQAEDGAPLCRVVLTDITERNLAEEALRVNVTLLKTALSAITGPWAVINTDDYSIVMANEAYGGDTVVGKSCFAVSHNLSQPCSGSGHLCPLLQVVSTGRAFTTEHIHFTKSDEPLNIEITAYPIFDNFGKVRQVVECGQDITERKQAETYREMSREILQILSEPGELQESIQRVLTVLKTQTGVDAVGLRLQEGEDFPYFVQEGFSQDFLQTENTLLERGKDGGVCRGKDGNVSLECTCGLVISGQTDPTNPLFTKGGSSWTNESFTLLDLPSDQDPRLHPRNNCIHQGYASVALIPVRFQDQMFSRETCVRHGFGSMAQVPVRTSDRIVGLVQLNDKRKGRFTLEMIEILESIAAHIGSALMRKRAEAKQEKLQAQLNQAQKIESVGRLAGGVAHDFNNMLGVIMGHAEMALMKADPSSPFISDLQEISNAAQRSATLTRQLLTFARKQVITPKVLDLNEAVASTFNMLQRLIGENIQLSWNPAANLWPVKVDPSQLDQILANLCINARDAIAGIGKISIKTANSTLSENDANALPYEAVLGDYVLLSVSDNGCGMDKQVQAHIFEPFYTTKEVGSGTGLGLATVYGAVKQHHGFITFDSEAGQGTVFNIFLPREKNTVETAPQATAQVLLHGTETILLVEDDEMLLRLVTAMLEECGYTVLSTATTEHAQSFAREHPGPIHLLISDVIMPVMNGRTLATRLLPLRPEIKTLFLSGYTADIISDQGGLQEDTNFLQKPFSFETLTAKVREVLDGQ